MIINAGLHNRHSVSSLFLVGLRLRFRKIIECVREIVIFYYIVEALQEPNLHDL